MKGYSIGHCSNCGDTGGPWGFFGRDKVYLCESCGEKFEAAEKAIERGEIAFKRENDAYIKEHLEELKKRFK